MSPAPRVRAEEPRLLTAGETAAMLRVSKTSIYRLVEARRIPFYRFPGSLRFSFDDVQAFVDGRRVEPVEKHFNV